MSFPYSTKKLCPMRNLRFLRKRDNDLSRTEIKRSTGFVKHSAGDL